MITEGREPDGTWRVLTMREAIERHIDEGFTDQEVLDLFHGVSAIVLDGEVLRLTPPGRRKLQAVIAQIRAERQPASRARLIPDVEGAIRQAVGELRREQMRLTWRNVASWLRANVPACQSLDEKTLRTWREEDELPSSVAHPRYQTPA